MQQFAPGKRRVAVGRPETSLYISSEDKYVGVYCTSRSGFVHHHGEGRKRTCVETSPTQNHYWIHRPQTGQRRRGVPNRLGLTDVLRYRLAIGWCISCLGETPKILLVMDYNTVIAWPCWHRKKKVDVASFITILKGICIWILWHHSAA